MNTRDAAIRYHEITGESIDPQAIRRYCRLGVIKHRVVRGQFVIEKREIERFAKNALSR